MWSVTEFLLITEVCTFFDPRFSRVWRSWWKHILQLLFLFFFHSGLLERQKKKLNRCPFWISHLNKCKLTWKAIAWLRLSRVGSSPSSSLSASSSSSLERNSARYKLTTPHTLYLSNVSSWLRFNFPSLAIIRIQKVKRLKYIHMVRLLTLFLLFLFFFLGRVSVT